ncbi:MAG: tRNA pseudouridine(55) synthase TruB [Bacteroidales bacterium]
MEVFHPESKFDFIKGEVLLIHKPCSWTSFDVVNKIRRLIRRTHDIRKIKVGHAGTLDPMASGLLIICTGKATKTIDRFSDMDKEYTGTMVLGAVTPSYDTETQVSRRFGTKTLTARRIHDAMQTFRGEIIQYPPVFSAVKIKGRRAYKFARTDEEVTLSPRLVSIHEFTADRIELPEVDFSVRCTKGTYIRSLVDDVGKALQNGAYLKSLVRIKIGDYSLSEAYSMEQIENIIISKQQKS